MKHEVMLVSNSKKKQKNKAPIVAPNALVIEIIDAFKYSEIF